jgi:CRISPR-associated protein Csm3
MEQRNRIISKKIFISGKIKTLTGLHIGGTESGISIGGVEQIVVRDPITNEPYIPGSSLKGKKRSMLEKLRGEYKIDKEGNAGPSKELGSLSARIFGISADEKDDSESENDKSDKVFDFKASRIIVRDSFLTKESRKKLQEANLDLPFTETKTETSIDRVTSKANPRTIERVPKDAEFQLDMVLTVYEGDDEKDLLDGLFTSMILLQEDYLGGHGSRGYGKIKFSDVKLSVKTNEIYRTGGDDISYNDIPVPDELRGSNESQGN